MKTRRHTRPGNSRNTEIQALVFSEKGFLGGVTLVAMPEYLFIVEHDVLRDRIRRIPYGDIREVTCGKVWSWLLPLLFLALMAAGLILLTDSSRFAVPLLAAAALLLAAIAITGGKSVFMVETGTKTIRAATLFMTKRKARVFLDAVLKHVARDQGERPVLLGRSSMRTDSAKPPPEPFPDLVEAEAVEESAVPLHED